MVLINLVPFLPGYRWHRTARIWRTPGLGELAMGVTVAFTLKSLSRESNVTPGPLPEEMRRLDHRPPRPGHRAGDPAPVPELPSRAPGRRRRAPGRRAMPRRSSRGARGTPTSPRASGAPTPSALPDAELLELPDAGHWPWLDRPDLPARVHEFLARG